MISKLPTPVVTGDTVVTLPDVTSFVVTTDVVKRDVVKGDVVMGEVVKKGVSSHQRGRGVENKGAILEL